MGMLSRKIAKKYISMLSIIICSGLHTVASADSILSNTMPSGGTVELGNVRIDSSDYIKTIDTISNNATIYTDAHSVINWKNFDIGSSATLNFDLNGYTLLNRVTGGKESQLLGRINGDINKHGGHLIISNSNGIVVGKNAVLNADTLTLSTMNFTASQFRDLLNGKKVSLSAGTRKNSITKKSEYSPITILGSLNSSNLTKVLNLYGGSIQIADGVKISASTSNIGNIEMIASSNIGFNKGTMESITANANNNIAIGNESGTQGNEFNLAQTLNMAGGSFTAYNTFFNANNGVYILAANKRAINISNGVIDGTETTSGNNLNKISLNGVSFDSYTDITGGSIIADGLVINDDVFMQAITGMSKSISDTIAKNGTLTYTATYNANNKSEIILSGASTGSDSGNISLWGGTIKISDSTISAPNIVLHAGNKYTNTDKLVVDKYKQSDMVDGYISGKYKEYITDSYVSAVSNSIIIDNSKIGTEDKDKLTVTGGTIKVNSSDVSGKKLAFQAGTSYVQNHNTSGSYEIYQDIRLDYVNDGETSPIETTYTTGKGTDVINNGSSVSGDDVLLAGAAVRLNSTTISGEDINIKAVGSYLRNAKTNVLSYTANNSNIVDLADSTSIDGNNVSILSGAIKGTASSITANNVDAYAVNNIDVTNNVYKAVANNKMSFNESFSIEAKENINLLGGSIELKNGTSLNADSINMWALTSRQNGWNGVITSAYNNSITASNDVYLTSDKLSISGGSINFKDMMVSSKDVVLQAGSKYDFSDFTNVKPNVNTKVIFSANANNKISLQNTQITSSDINTSVSIKGGSVDLKGNPDEDGINMPLIDADKIYVQALSSVSKDRAGNISASAGTGNSVSASKSAKLSANENLSVYAGAVNLNNNAEISVLGTDEENGMEIYSGSKFNFDTTNYMTGFAAGTGNSIKLNSATLHSANHLNLTGGSIAINNNGMALANGNMVLNAISSYARSHVPVYDEHGDIVNYYLDETYKAGTGNALTIQGSKDRKGNITSYAWAIAGMSDSDEPNKLDIKAGKINIDNNTAGVYSLNGTTTKKQIASYSNEVTELTPLEKAEQLEAGLELKEVQSNNLMSIIPVPIMPVPHYDEDKEIEEDK